MTSREIALGFLNAPTIEEKLKWVRSPEKVEPMIREFYQGKESTVDKFYNLVEQDRGLFADTVFEQFQFIGESETRIVIVCDTKGGRRG